MGDAIGPTTHDGVKPVTEALGTSVPPGRRVVVLGGGFAGVYAARHLGKRFRGDQSAHVTLVSKVNYFLMTPLLFEAGSGVLEPRHAVNPIRRMFRKTRFVEADIEGVDLDARK